MKALRWAGGGGGGMLKTTREARSIKTGHANAAPCPLLEGCRSNIRATSHTKSKKDAVSTSWKCSCKERLSVASQADGMAFYRWEIRVSWRCIYSYFRWVGFFLFCFLPDRTDACWDVVGVFFSCLKEACRLLHIIFFPEGQAVELLQGHAENLHEVLRR